MILLLSHATILTYPRMLHLLLNGRESLFLDPNLLTISIGTAYFLEVAEIYVRNVPVNLQHLMNAAIKGTATGQLLYLLLLPRTSWP